MSAGAALDVGRSYFDTEEGRRLARLQQQQQAWDFGQSQPAGVLSPGWSQAQPTGAAPQVDTVNTVVDRPQPPPEQPAWYQRGGLRPYVQPAADAAANYAAKAWDAAKYYVPPELRGKAEAAGEVAPALVPDYGAGDYRTAAAAAQSGDYPKAAVNYATGGLTQALDTAGLHGPLALAKGAVSTAAAAVPAARRAAAIVKDVARDERGGGRILAPPPSAEAAQKLEQTVYKPSAPAILRDEAEAATDAIFRHAERPENLTPKYPPAKEPVFTLGEDLGRQATLDRVSQESIRDRLPGPEPGRNKPLPVNDRARIIQDKAEEIGTAIADDLRQGRGNVAKQRSFYYTGPVLEGLEDKAGLSTKEAVQHMEDWSGQGSATSPRTKTPSNLRNASYLLWRDRQGFPLDAETRAAEGNLSGFPMMDMHANLGRGFAEGTHDYWRNPKPGTFQGNWAGNMADVTGDTHYIRGTLGKLDDIYKGQLPREWFTSDEAFKAYKDRGGFAPGKLPYDLSDKLPHEAIKGRKRQTEYGILTEPGYIAARQLGIAPAEAQAQMWFHYGPRTGLRSPESSIPDLLNSQIEETARATGLHPEKILQFWSRGRIPLAANEGTPSSSAVG